MENTKNNNNNDNIYLITILQNNPKFSHNHKVWSPKNKYFNNEH